MARLLTKTPNYCKGKDTEAEAIFSVVRDEEQVLQKLPAAPRLMDRVREVMRFRHYSLRTEEAYTSWIRRYTP